ncbi:allophanate hydrolase [Shouchella clausii]|uniref:allophanate hydrolase n=1 Tax=Shouchella clausii TaxID=79880 RepID=UPI0031FD7659
MAWETITQLRAAYLAKQTTPEAEVNRIIEQAQVDRDYNIWISAPAKSQIEPFLARLAKLDPKEAPLWGIPFAVKDNIDVQGYETTAGCPDYAYMPEKSATVVDRLVAAGAIPIGKTNLDQFATGLVGTRSPYGETKNGCNPSYISGGSSSGSAVAVARKQVLFALGTDTAGSGRVPASVHGLIGWKPSIGAWPTTGVVPACASIDCVTVFTHTIEDAYKIDKVVRGLDSDDPFSKMSMPLAVGEPTRYILPKKESLRFYGPHATAFEEAWEASVSLLETQEAQVDFIDTALLAEAASLLYDGPLVAERWAAVGAFIDRHPQAAFPVTEKVIRTGQTYDAAALFTAQHKLKAIKRDVWNCLGENSVLMMPTNGGTYTREEVRESPISTNNDMGLYTNHCNLLDLCAIAVPGAKQADGLPFGITFFAPHDGEHLVIGAAAAWSNACEPKAIIAVCGLHMRGFPLEPEMHKHRAVFKEEARTAPAYKLARLPGEVAKPGLIKQNSGGSAIELELWEMPQSELGRFLATIPAPLGLGKLKLSDGREVIGFICEGAAAEEAEEITAFGGWRKAMAARRIKS